MDTASWTTVGAVAALIVKSYFDERKRAQDREEDRKDRAAAAALTKDHRALMSGKLDANTEASVVAAQASVAAAEQTEKIAQQTNGLKTELVALTQKAAFAEGKLAGENDKLPAHIDVTLHPADSTKVPPTK
jgi:hypothetical protein